LEQQLTKSLFSKSKASVSKMSILYGRNYFPSTYSRPYILCFAIDVAWVAIDYSKGNMNEGVIDSPSSQGSIGKIHCSSSLLKKVACTISQLYLYLPISFTKTTPRIKLYVDVDKDVVDFCPNSKILLPTIHVHLFHYINKLELTSTLKYHKKKDHLDSSRANHFFCLQNNRFLPLQFLLGRPSPLRNIISHCMVI